MLALRNATKTLHAQYGTLCEHTLSHLTPFNQKSENETCDTNVNNIYELAPKENIDNIENTSL